MPKTGNWETGKSYTGNMRKMDGLQIKKALNNMEDGWILKITIEECEEKNEWGYRTEGWTPETGGNPAERTSGFILLHQE